MHAETTDRAEINATVQTLLRILVASYFLAAALGMIPGTDFTALAGLIAEPQTAAVLTAVVVFSLAYMVMIGWHTRTAALLLGLVTFFSAYLSLVAPGGAANIGAFWRDMALIGALMLTYTDRAATNRKRPMMRRHVLPRRIAATGQRTQRPVAAKAVFASKRAAAVAAPKFSAVMIDLAEARARKITRPTDLRAPLEAEEIDNIFLDDLSFAQAR